MSRYYGYAGRNVYREEHWYPAVSIVARVVADIFASAQASGLPYLLYDGLDASMALGYGAEGSPRRNHYDAYFGWYVYEVELEGATIRVVSWNASVWADISLYLLDPLANHNVAVVRRYPDSTIPLNWGLNVWKPPLFS